MSDLDEIKKKKLEELMKQQIGQQNMQEAQLEEELKKAMSQILTSRARERLANIRASKPEFATQVKILILQLAQSNQIKIPLDEIGLKEILNQLVQKKDFRIRRK